MLTVQKNSSFFTASNCVPINNEKMLKAHKDDKKTAELLEIFEKSPNAINENLKPLYTYLYSTEHYIKKKWQPDNKISESESQNNHDNIKCIIRNENARKKDLNLSLVLSPSTFKDHLITKEDYSILTPPFHQRCIVGFTNPSGDKHYIYADIKANVDKALSVIFIDSLQCKELGQSVAEHEKNKSLYHSLAGALEKLTEFKKISVAIIPTGVQNSPNGCQIFSMSFALKSYQYESLFSQWHAHCLEEKIIYGEKIFNDKKEATIQSERLNLASYYTMENGINSRPAITLANKTKAYIYDHEDSCNLLPADFFKHSSSTTLIKHVLKKLECEEQISTPPKKEALAKSKSKLIATLEHGPEYRKKRKGENNSADIINKKNEVISKYLATIEYKRRAFILRTIDAEEQKLTSKNLFCDH